MRWWPPDIEVKAPLLQLASTEAIPKWTSQEFCQISPPNPPKACRRQYIPKGKRRFHSFGVVCIHFIDGVTLLMSQPQTCLTYKSQDPFHFALKPKQAHLWCAPMSSLQTEVSLGRVKWLCEKLDSKLSGCDRHRFARHSAAFMRVTALPKRKKESETVPFKLKEIVE